MNTIAHTWRDIKAIGVQLTGKNARAHAQHIVAVYIGSNPRSYGPFASYEEAYAWAANSLADEIGRGVTPADYDLLPLIDPHKKKGFLN